MLKGKFYEINSKNIYAHELLGLQVQVVQSSDKNKKGITGLVVDESKNLFVVETKNGLKKVPKKEAVFVFFLGSEKAEVDGKKVLFRPQDRVKVFWRSCF